MGSTKKYKIQGVIFPKTKSSDSFVFDLRFLLTACTSVALGMNRMVPLYLTVLNFSMSM